MTIETTPIPPPSPTAQGLLERALAACQDQAVRALARADGPPQDIGGNDSTDRDFRRAMALLKITARLGTVMAQMNSHRSQTHVVHRSDGGTAAPKLAEARSKLAMIAAQKAGDEEFWERWRTTFFDEAARREAAATEEAERHAEEGAPHPNSSGSNDENAVHQPRSRF